MNDKMNELVQFSPFSGELTLLTVSGEASKKIEHENDVHAADGVDRTIYAYAPVSGCPDAKQNQILMVLRDDSSEESAVALMENLELKFLCEQEHFLLLLPNPQKGGWNYNENPNLDNDMDFLGRCFGMLRGSELGVNGFNGMIFYIAASEGASALLMTMAAKKPSNVPAMMISSFPGDYKIPADALHVETAAWVSSNAAAESYLKKSNGVSSEEAYDGEITYYGANPNCRLLVTEKALSAETVYTAWNRLFCVTRRWQNDIHGTYQKRTNFTERGFTAHVKDTSLGCNNGFAHTWYEYIPPQLRGTDDKVPLLVYFHGVNCVPLYGAEQSGWHDIADQENFIVVYPAPSVHKAWNMYNDPSLPCDFDFVLALIEHMKAVHPIDETRIYSAGFSMGSMMTHAITAVYPEVFAAAAPCNAFDFAYFEKPKDIYRGVVKGANVDAMVDDSVQRQMADAKRAAFDFRMPMLLNAGFNDAGLATWPAKADVEDVRTKTLDRWMKLNNIPGIAFDETTLSGLKADESFYEDEDERFFHQRWHSQDEGNPVLYELVLAKRMPHAIDLAQPWFAWNFIKKFRRLPDGTLKIEDETLSK